MMEVVTETKIFASAADTWSALLDFENYPRWHPSVSIRGMAAAGETIEYSFKIDHFDRRLWSKARISRFEEQESVAWTFGVPGLFKFEESFSLQQEGRWTDLQHEVRCWGFIPFIAGRRMRGGIHLMLTQSNAGLDQYLAGKGSSSRARKDSAQKNSPARGSKRRRPASKRR